MELTLDRMLPWCGTSFDDADGFGPFSHAYCVCIRLPYLRHATQPNHPEGSSVDLGSVRPILTYTEANYGSDGSPARCNWPMFLGFMIISHRVIDESEMCDKELRLRHDCRAIMPYGLIMDLATERSA